MILWHNPLCSKSRAALELAHNAKQDVIVREYLKEPPTVEELKSLGIPPKFLIRSKESLFQELGLSLKDSPETLFQAMAEHPKLIERPVVITEQCTIIARPPERILEC